MSLPYTLPCVVQAASALVAPVLQLCQFVPGRELTPSLHIHTHTIHASLPFMIPRGAGNICPGRHHAVDMPV